MYVIYYDIIVSSCILTFCSTVAVMRLIGYWLQVGSLKRWIKHLCPRKMYQYAIEFVCCPLDFTCTSLKDRERGSHQAVWWFSKTAGDFQPQYPYFPGLWQHFPGWWGPGGSSPWPMWPTPFWESIGHELPTWWCGRRPKKSRRSTVLIQNLGSGMNGSMWMAQFFVMCKKILWKTVVSLWKVKANAICHAFKQNNYSSTCEGSWFTVIWTQIPILP